MCIRDRAGTTRDRQYGKSEWVGHEFSVVDTGGWVVPACSFTIAWRVLVRRLKSVDSVSYTHLYFGKDQWTDKPARFFVTEIIREKILLYYDKEIPYSVEVVAVS